MKLDLVDDSFWFNIRFLRCAGLYPTKNYKGLYNVYAYIMYFLFVVPDPTLDIVYLALDEEITLRKVVDNLFLIAQTGSFIVKELVWIRNFVQIEETVDYLRLPIFNQYKDRHEKLFRDCFRTCKIITWLFFGFCEASIVGLNIRPLFSGVIYKLPVDVWLPFGFDENRLVLFWFCYAIVGVGIFCVGSSNGVLDPLIAGLTYHAATQLMVLKDNLQFLADDTDEELEATAVENETEMEKKKRGEDILYRRITECVDHHSAILVFVDKIEHTYSYVVFTQFLTAMFVICICCYQLTLLSPLSIPFVGMVVFFLTMVIEIYLYCYYGTILYDASNSLTTAAYMGRWYEFDVRARKALLVLMERSKKPMVITAGKVLDISVVTFTTILRRAYSLFAVMKSY